MAAVSFVPNPCVYCTKEVEASVADRQVDPHKRHLYCWKKHNERSPLEAATCQICQKAIGKEMDDLYSRFNAELTRVDLDLQLMQIVQKRKHELERSLKGPFSISPVSQTIQQFPKEPHPLFASAQANHFPIPFGQFLAVQAPEYLQIEKSAVRFKQFPEDSQHPEVILAYKDSPQEKEKEGASFRIYPSQESLLQALHLTKSSVYQVEEVQQFIEGRSFFLSNWPEQIPQLSMDAPELGQQLCRNCTADKIVFKLFRTSTGGIWVGFRNATQFTRIEPIPVFKDRYWYFGDADKTIREIEKGASPERAIRKHFEALGWIDVDAKPV